MSTEQQERRDGLYVEWRGLILTATTGWEEAGKRDTVLVTFDEGIDIPAAYEKFVPWEARDGRRFVPRSELTAYFRLRRYCTWKGERCVVVKVTKDGRFALWWADRTNTTARTWDPAAMTVTASEVSDLRQERLDIPLAGAAGKDFWEPELQDGMYVEWRGILLPLRYTDRAVHGIVGVQFPDGFDIPAEYQPLYRPQRYIWWRERQNKLCRAVPKSDITSLVRLETYCAWKGERCRVDRIDDDGHLWFSWAGTNTSRVQQLGFHRSEYDGPDSASGMQAEVSNLHQERRNYPNHQALERTENQWQRKYVTVHGKPFAARSCWKHGYLAVDFPEGFDIPVEYERGRPDMDWRLVPETVQPELLDGLYVEWRDLAVPAFTSHLTGHINVAFPKKTDAPAEYEPLSPGSDWRLVPELDLTSCFRLQTKCRLEGEPEWHLVTGRNHLGRLILQWDGSPTPQTEQLGFSNAEEPGSPALGDVYTASVAMTQVRDLHQERTTVPLDGAAE